jgi:hypothetical protein
MASTLLGEAGTAELRDFARRIGLRDAWLQRRGTPYEHYDLFGDRRQRAVRAGAVELDRRQMVEVFRAKRTPATGEDPHG